MEKHDAPLSDLESEIEYENDASPETPVIPNLLTDLVIVSMVDGIWQDQPDHVATFAEERLGKLGRGRGNLYVCLDVSGELDGRSEIERALVEVVRDTYAASRGSVSFGLSEALRAANVFLFDSNRQQQRELRRMAGISAVVLRGNDLYICQAGPSVVYAEASEKLARFPAESDWFTEDAPLISPHGTASAPLGIRREFASDLAHISVNIGDVFVLASRALTQLATTQELAIAFTERSAQEISEYLEELGQDADLTALVVELAAPPQENILLASDLTDANDEYVQNEHIESIPVPLDSLVIPDETEPELEEPVDAEPVPAFAWAAAQTQSQTQAVDEPELNWDDDETLSQENVLEQEDAEPEPVPVPVHAAAVAMPMPRAPVFLVPQPQAAPIDYEAELERRRAERAARRAAQQAGMQRALGGVVSAVALVGGAFSGMWHRVAGDVDWKKKGKQTNRTLNLAVGALVAFFLLLVRLVLPGAPVASTKLVPRRATSEPVWLKAFALALPVLLILLAGARYYQTITARQAQFESLLVQAENIIKQSEITTDRAQSLAQLQDARKIMKQATALQQSPKAQNLLNRILDRQNELNGISLFRAIQLIARAGGGTTFSHIAVLDQDVFLLDGQDRVYHYIINDDSFDAKPAESNPLVLKPGSTFGEETIAHVYLVTSAPLSQNQPLIAAVTDKGILAYDLQAQQWKAYEIQDTHKWGELRAIDAFGGSIYLLDAKNNQIYKYAATDAGYSPTAAPYFVKTKPLLSKAVDMTIDGDVWILNSNGTVQRFRSDKPVAFQLDTLAVPLKNPVAIYTRAESDALFIADAGNQRIVEFDKNGKFVREYKTASDKSDAMTNLQDLTVNELKRKVYFVTSSAAYFTNLAR